MQQIKYINRMCGSRATTPILQRLIDKRWSFSSTSIICINTVRSEMENRKAQWRTLKTSGPIPLGRSSHGVVVIGRSAYVFGGENKPRIPIGSTLHCLDLDSLLWSVCTPKEDSNVPEKINASSVAAVADDIYVFGGRSGIGMEEGNSNELYVFNTKSCCWTKPETTGSKPSPRSYHAMTAVGTKLYVFGGCGDQGRLSDLHSYDTETKVWEKLPESKEILGRGGAGLTSVDRNIYVVGGFTGRESNDVHSYNIDSKVWTKLTFENELPPRSVFGIVPIGKYIVTIAGEIDPSDKGHSGAGGFSDECFVLDTSSQKRWVKLSPDGTVPEPRGWFQAKCFQKDDATTGIFVFGGNSLSNERLKDCHLLEITEA